MDIILRWFKIVLKLVGIKEFFGFSIRVVFLLVVSKVFILVDVILEVVGWFNVKIF